MGAGNGAKNARMGDPKRAVAYLRVSTEEQELGPEAQRAQLEAWAAREGITIVRWHQEAGVSGGAELVDRPELLAAVRSLRENGAGVLAVAKRDRMAREVGLARDIAGDDGIVRAAGAVVRSADGMSDLKGAAGKFTETVIDGVAEYERGVIRERTKAALDAKRRRGEAVGTPPYGYRIGPGTKLVEVPEEQAVIREIGILRYARKTERAIAKELEARGLYSRAGTPFSQTQVHRILKRLDAAPPERPKTRGCAKDLPIHPPIRCRIEPFVDLAMSVNLDHVIWPFENPPAKEATILRLADWIVRGFVRLRVVSLTHCLQPGWLEEAERLSVLGSGKDLHQFLCAVGALFLRDGCGKTPVFGGSSSAGTYTAGISDVAASDGSLFVECGTIREDKVEIAMFGGERVLVIPAGGWGDGSLPRATVDRLIDQVELQALLDRPKQPSALIETTPEDCRRAAAVHVTLGFMFSPTLAGADEFKERAAWHRGTYRPPR